MTTSGVVSQQTVDRNPADFSAGVPTIKPMAGVERVFGAQQVQVYRDEGRVLNKLKALAAAAGNDWYYRFPVRNQSGQTDWIEGPSIKLANDLCRIYGNCDVDTRVIDLGDFWLFYARFIDLESGYSLTRPFQQRKAQTSMRTKDPGRAQDIAFQIGCSKAIRNVAVNALQTFADFAFEEARNALVQKIGGDLERYRQRTIEGISRVPVDLHRVELVVGRAAKDWLAPDVARVIAMLKSIADGMASVEETFPDPNAKEKEETPARPSTITEAFEQFGAAGSGETPDAGQQPEQTAEDAKATAAARSPEAAPASGVGDQQQQAEVPDPLAIAHARGFEARKLKHDRKALPGEYRDASRTAEAKAWFKGWDGEPL